MVLANSGVKKEILSFTVNGRERYGRASFFVSFRRSVRLVQQRREAGRTKKILRKRGVSKLIRNSSNDAERYPDARKTTRILRDMLGRT